MVELSRREWLGAVLSMAGGVAAAEAVDDEDGGAFIGAGGGGTSEPTPPFSVDQASGIPVYAAPSEDDLGPPSTFPAVIYTMDAGLFIDTGDGDSYPSDGSNMELVESFYVAQTVDALETDPTTPALGFTQEAGVMLDLGT